MQTVPLLDNQRQKIEKFARLKVGADFSDPGTGKTRSTVEVINSTDATLCVWVAPYGTINQPDGQSSIKDEVLKWQPTMPVYFVAAESISMSDRIYLETIRVMKGQRVFMVVDESLKIKNHDAKRTERIIELGKEAEYRMILNGTALSRCLMDIWAQMEFLSPLILNMRLAEYKNTFCEYTRIKKKGYKPREFITAYHNVDTLFSLIEPYVFDCRINLDITRQFIELPYEVGQEEKKEYKRLKDLYLSDDTMQWKNNNIFLELTQKMQHGYCISDDKFAVLDQYLNGKNRRKVLIYRKFVESETRLKLRYPGIPILSIQSHAQGLNLQDYNTIILWDKTWDYGLIDQVFPRIFRTGQKDNCTFVDLTGDLPLDAMMQKNVINKGSLLMAFKERGYKKIMEEL